MKISQKEHNEKIVKELSANPALRLDKLWRMNNLFWLVTKDGTKEVFTMNKAQKDFFDTMLNIPNPFHRHCILKSRQLGFTTFIDLYILDEILFNTNKEGLVIAHKVEDAKEIFDRKIDFALRNMAEQIKDAMFKLQRNSAKKIQVIIDYGPDKDSTSSIQVSLSGRSGTYHYVHISEFAKLCALYPKRADEVETGTFPSVPFDGFIFIESTAEGMGGRFYEIFQEGWLAKDKITPMISRVRFLSHFYNWQWDEMEMKKISEPIPIENMDECEIDWKSYQEEHGLTPIEITYYYMKWLQLGGAGGTDTVKKLNQEYPTTPEEAFLATGQTYFPTGKVVRMMENVQKGKRGEIVRNMMGNLEFAETSAGQLTLFRLPENGEQVVVGGDTAEGLAKGDAQVLYGISHKTKECLFLYVSQEDPSDFITSAYQIGMFFNKALLAIEVNKDGLWVNDGLNKMGYPNLYSRKILDDITQKVTLYFGWKTTAATRPFSLAALKAIFLQKDHGFPAQLLGEMFTFIRNAKGRPEAMSGKHDDCFVKNTMVLTDKGNVPIQNIKIGDLVMTRNGYKSVINIRNKKKKIISNIGLIGTSDHPIILANGEEKQLCKINHYDTLHVWNPKENQIQKLSYIEAKSIIESQTLNSDSIEFTSGDMINGSLHLFHCIGKFGLIILEKFQKVCMFIIKMAILLIMKLQILSYYLNQIIRNYIYRNEGQKSKVYVYGVKRNLIISLLEKLNSAVINVIPKTDIVYNLQVEENPEYFANGILVHNCIMAAAIGYAVLQELGKYLEVKGSQTPSVTKAMWGEN